MSGRRNRRNFYRILHVQPDAPPAVLKSSYRALMLSLEMHPDRGGDHWNAALVNEAYGVLSDPVRRAEYDRTLDVAQVGRRRGAGGVAMVGGPDRSPVSPAVTDDADGAQCLFCGSPCADVGRSSPDTVCPTCKSPLHPADTARSHPADRRTTRRVSGDGELRYFLVWPQPNPGRGRIVDVSPGGLRFECDEPIGEFLIVKLVAPLLDTVGVVVSCHGRADTFAVGVQFSTVRYHQPRGAFLSTEA